MGCSSSPFSSSALSCTTVVRDARALELRPLPLSLLASDRVLTIRVV
jgi:hypothetical protein